MPELDPDLTVIMAKCEQFFDEHFNPSGPEFRAILGFIYDNAKSAATRLAWAERVVEVAKAVEEKCIESYNAKNKPSDEWDEYDEMMLPLWAHLKAALAAHAKGEA